MIEIRIYSEDDAWWARIVQRDAADQLQRMLKKRFLLNQDAWNWAKEIAKSWQAKYVHPPAA